jgi:hypothetical protein
MDRKGFTTKDTKNTKKNKGASRRTRFAEEARTPASTRFLGALCVLGGEF